MKKLKFDNAWMVLLAKSMKKVHEITHICENAPDTINKGLVTVCQIAGFDALAAQYPAERIPSSTIKSDHNLYIRSDKNLFGVGLVSSSVREINEFLSKNDDYGLIASDNNGLHYAATLKPVQ